MKRGFQADPLSPCRGFGVTYEGLKLQKKCRHFADRMRFGVTYEGLKPSKQPLFNVSLAGFGVTYEGLKPGKGSPAGAIFWRFGVTYEGLKLCFTKSMRGSRFNVLELPMRV